VHEDVVIVLLLDEAEGLLGREPLDFTLRHFVLLLILKRVTPVLGGVTRCAPCAARAGL
jgi:hypothetical protein